MAAPLDTLTFKQTVSANWNAQQNSEGNSPTMNNTTIAAGISLGTSVAPGVAGGADQLQSEVLTIAASGNTVVNLAATFTNIVNVENATWARIKSVTIRLLSVADDSVNGTNCASITVGNTGANGWTSQAGSGWFNNVSSSMDVPNGGVLAFGVPNAAGVAVDATHKLLTIVNNDNAVAAAVPDDGVQDVWQATAYS